MPISNGTEDSPLNVRVVPRDVDYYYINESEIDNITSKTIICEIFIFFASLMAGALLTTSLTKWIYKNSAVALPTELNILLWVFSAGFLIFGVLFIWMLSGRNSAKKRILNLGKVELESE